MKNACQRVLSYKLSTYKSLAFYFGSAGFGTENLTWIFDLSHLLWPPGCYDGVLFQPSYLHFYDCVRTDATFQPSERVIVGPGRAFNFVTHIWYCFS